MLFLLNGFSLVPQKGSPMYSPSQQLALPVFLKGSPLGFSSLFACVYWEQDVPKYLILEIGLSQPPIGSNPGKT